MATEATQLKLDTNKWSWHLYSRVLPGPNKIEQGFNFLSIMDGVMVTAQSATRRQPEIKHLY
jgi:hypothetical protein